MQSKTNILSVCYIWKCVIFKQSCKTCEECWCVMWLDVNMMPMIHTDATCSNKKSNIKFQEKEIVYLQLLILCNFRFSNFYMNPIIAVCPINLYPENIANFTFNLWLLQINVEDSDVEWQLKCYNILVHTVLFYMLHDKSDIGF